MSLLELIAAMLAAGGVALTARRRLLGFPVSLAACALYLWVFFQARLYSDALLQIVFMGFTVYGWNRWRQHLNTEQRVCIAPQSWPNIGRDLSLGGLAAVLLAALMQNYTHAALPWLDAALSSFSLVAQFWQSRRHLSNWWLWIGIDTLYVLEYLAKGLWITALLYAGFVWLAMQGLYHWRRVSQQTATASPAMP